MRDDAVLRRALPLGGGLGRLKLDKLWTEQHGFVLTYPVLLIIKTFHVKAKQFHSVVFILAFCSAAHGVT